MTTESKRLRSRPPMSWQPTSLSGTPKACRLVVSAPTCVPGKATSKRKRGRRGGRVGRAGGGAGGGDAGGAPRVVVLGALASQCLRVRSGSDRALQKALLLRSGSSVRRR